MRVAGARQRARERERSLCGPECLAELLRRRGEGADVHALAREMGTDERGTSLLALWEAAKRRGLAAQGLALTQRGLQQQKLPLVALLSPAHFVLVEQVGPGGVRVWDPDAGGAGRAGRRQYAPAEWSRAWGGIALALR